MTKGGGEEIPLLDEFAPAKWGRFTVAERARVRACLSVAEAVGYAALVACLGVTASDSRVASYVLDYLMQHPALVNRAAMAAQSAVLLVMGIM